MATETYNAYQLANMADCMSPDSDESPGAQFLLNIAEDVEEAFNEERWDEEAAHEIADQAVPVYTYQRWQTFVDLGAWEQDDEGLCGSDDDMTQRAAVALYVIAARLADAIAREREDTGDDDDDSDD